MRLILTSKRWGFIEPNITGEFIKERNFRAWPGYSLGWRMGKLAIISGEIKESDKGCRISIELRPGFSLIMFDVILLINFLVFLFLGISDSGEQLPLFILFNFFLIIFLVLGKYSKYCLKDNFERVFVLKDSKVK
ncbi:MAG: hypothetical protein K1X55_08465 [Chitinophagales bacterium]|nr:hypothetical protein [Chitinophagales bacterium]